MNFEGAGDALFCGETLFAGYRFRSDVRSHQWVGERLGVPVLPLELVDPRFYHLDTCFCPLGPGCGDLLPWRLRRLRPLGAEGPDRPAWSRSRPRRRSRSVATPWWSAARSSSTRAPRSWPPRCETLGFDVRPLEFSEFIKSGGSAKCLTLRLDGEEAAGWKHAGQISSC